MGKAPNSKETARSTSAEAAVLERQRRNRLAASRARKRRTEEREGLRNLVLDLRLKIGELVSENERLRARLAATLGPVAVVAVGEGNILTPVFPDDHRSSHNDMAGGSRYPGCLTHLWTASGAGATPGTDSQGTITEPGTPGRVDADDPDGLLNLEGITGLLPGSSRRTPGSP